MGGPMVVMLTATPKAIIRKFEALGVPYTCLDYYGKVYEDKTRQRIYYSSFADALCQINGKMLIYVPTIGLMKEYAELAKGLFENVVCLWSLRSGKEMNYRQLSVREALLHEERIPDDVDILLINAAYETSINIRNTDFKTMIVHCSNPDTQVQVRGLSAIDHLNASAVP